MKAIFSLMGALCPENKQLTNNPIGICKPPVLIILLTLLCFVFAAKAQEIEVHSTPAAKAEAKSVKPEIKPLKIGDKIPDELWNLYFPVVSTQSDEVQQLTLGDFKDKLVILDFWATWCSPCVAMIPKMDSLQKVFGDKMQFLSVTYQRKGEVLPFLAKLEQVKEQRYHLPVLADDNHLRFVFPHTGLPHYVWIENGVVKSITGYQEVNAENIQALVSREDTELKAKVDEKRLLYDRKKPLFIDSNGGKGEAMKYHSVLAGYTPGLASGYSFIVDSANESKVTLTNTPLHKIYAAAFGGRSPIYRKLNRIVFDVKKLEGFRRPKNRDFSEWASENLYIYEINTPTYLTSSVFELMKDDLEKLFPQYKAYIDKRTTTCLVLIRNSKRDKLKSRSNGTLYKLSSIGYTIQNGYLMRFVQDLNLFPLQNSRYPLIDETEYSGKVDLELIANLSDVESINKGLEKYDLKIIEAEREIDMLIIRDTEAYNQSNQTEKLKP